MKNIDFILKSFINAGAVVIYVSAVVWLMSNGQNIFGKRPDQLIMPLFLLLLFIISATITSLLVLGKPILLYLEGLKKEALSLLGATLAWLVFFLVIVAVILKAIKY